MTEVRGSDDGPGTGRAGLTVVPGEQVLDESGHAFLFLAIEVSVFKEIQVAGTADSFHFAE